MFSFLFLLLCYEHSDPQPCLDNAGVTFRSMMTTRTPERGYSTVPYHLGRTAIPVTLKVYAPLGCMLTFSNPYDDVWLSNPTSWKIIPWGQAETAKKVIISNLFDTSEPANLFFNYGNETIEILLTQVPSMEMADRFVTIRVNGLPPKPIQSPETEEDQTEGKNVNQTILEPLLGPRRSIETPHGLLIYSFDENPFLFFRPYPNSPAIESVELVRATKRKWRKTFKFEYPVPPSEQETVGEARLLIYPKFGLEKRERLYLRVIAFGERTPRYTKLRIKP